MQRDCALSGRCSGGDTTEISMYIEIIIYSEHKFHLYILVLLGDVVGIVTHVVVWKRAPGEIPGALSQFRPSSLTLFSTNSLKACVAYRFWSPRSVHRALKAAAISLST